MEEQNRTPPPHEASKPESPDPRRRAHIAQQELMDPKLSEASVANAIEDFDADEN